MKKRIIYLLFFFSGFSALVYEIIWARKLSLVFGLDSYAISTIIAVYFTGLALGSFIFGKLVDRTKKSPLYIYGLLEVGVGAYAALTPWLFKAIQAIQASLWLQFEPSFGQFSMISLVLSVLVLIIPTTLMGGTLPVISKFFAYKEEEVGKAIGGLYSVNTLGAVIGVFASGFLLISYFGVNQSIWIASFISVLVGIVAFRLSKETQKEVVKEKPLFQGKPNTLKILLLVIGLSGFAAISVEVLLARIMVTVVGGSTYAFSLVLISFLLGISLGSALISRIIDRLRSHMIWIAILELLLGISVFLLIPIIGNLPFWFLSFYQSFGSSFSNLQMGIFLMMTVVFIIPTFLMGAVFPIAIKAYKSKGLGDRVGKLYAVNTFGGVLGSLATGFLLISLVGVEKSIVIAASIYLMGAILIITVSKTKLVSKVIVIVVSIAIVFLGNRNISWDKYVMTSGFYTNPESLLGIEKEELLRRLRSENLLYEADGVSAHVAVVEDKSGNITLKINGKTDASTSSDMENQLLLGHLPMLLHKDPKDVLVVGMGSGITLGSVLSHHTVETVDAIEIEPSVIEAAEYFNQYSNNAIKDPRVNIITADGRNFLSATENKYDVITSEPSNPWLSGSSKLFTKEYFELLESGVNEEGIVLQWINLYALDVNGLKSVMAAFDEVFPEVIVFGMAISNDLAMIGSKNPILFDYRLLSERLEEEMIINDLEKIGISKPFEIFSYFVMDDKAVSQLVKGATPNSDNHPIVEFSAPKSLYLPTTVNPWRVVFDNLSEIASVMDSSIFYPENQIAKAESFRKSRLLTEIHVIERNLDKAIEEGEKALEIDSNNPFLEEKVARLNFEKGSSLLNNQEYSQAIVNFSRSLEIKEIAEAYINLGLSYQGMGNFRKAENTFEKAIENNSQNDTIYLYLGLLQIEIGDLNKAINNLEKALELNSENITAKDSLNELYQLRDHNDN